MKYIILALALSLAGCTTGKTLTINVRDCHEIHFDTEALIEDGPESFSTEGRLADQINAVGGKK